MIPTVAWAVLAGILGLAVGSFLNVVIYRVPAGESIVSPPSRCPRCGNQIRNRHNVPVLGWLILRGRCADCGEPISPRYPLVEAATAIAFALVTAALVAADLGAAVPAYLALAAFAITLAMIAVDRHPAPRTIAVVALVGVVLLLVVASAVRHDWFRLVGSAVGAVVALAVFVPVAALARLAPLAILVGVGAGWLV
ncbi:MAG: prepilin peptidase [Jatrophihabitantaceae bacterium]